MTTHARPVFLDRSTPPHIVTLVLLAGLSAMNMSVFLPSLPAMTEHFGTDYTVMQLSVSLYLATTAVMQIFIGPLSDRFGRRPVVLWALVVFLLATLGCMLAPNVEVFLACRMAQAFVAVGLVLSRAVVRDMYPQNEAASRIGYVTMGMSLVPMFAPMIGGLLDELFGWRAIFVFLMMSGGALGWLCWRDLGETATSTGIRFADQIRDYPELLLSRRFWGYAMSAAFASGAFFAFLGGAPYAADHIFGLTPFWAGICFGAPAIGYTFGNFLSGRFAARVGINPLILLGTAIASVGLSVSVLLGALGVSGPVPFFAFTTTVGIGNGLVVPNASAGLLSVRPQLAGTASGLGGAIMIGGGAALSVLAGVLLEGRTTAMPLQILMAASSALSLIAIIYVILRERELQLAS
ncbi:DHA1 family bicyclomycin/chloramphenicol resistance-like MFS transporter [Aliiruegeria haliotis]|uniref:Bcr/CflA family efflux transporter n=1 Tax=Aliiruegeria haliotis TaxID=1280846 RepID=A0A2T0RV91_9RHOB|nr:multidrug effflux MFS transporter [Aliiruegeria haliotis]PRY25058.1 DHA1 family bicyclomycin/chloramphenicol resistance-like MFS transporter [Aliiruegeria haliotis]